ncbi:unnamed protein product [Peronospora farinosa]|uniref:Uncharacterized protein n=1 Tax=Peronospora farinosa TaxID=134698 RepID=A0AAV0U4I0_9STRA|nr:unnamed protein product [Peronospora farinosa]CAI5731684.1 unnamed protein product [Peronospora farinosa]
MKPNELGPFGNVLVQHGSDFDPTSEQFALLSKIAAKRVEWLEGDIHKLDKLSKTFSWEMPYADSEFEEITEFLRGFRKAKKFAATVNLYRYSDSSYVAKAIEGDGASVTITKIRQWYEDSQAKLARYTEEMANLSKVYRSVDMISTNKPRLELETRIGGLT